MAGEARRRQLADAIREARKGYRLTQQALADLSGVSRSTISNAERARGDIDPDSLAKLERALGCDFSEAALLGADSLGMLKGHVDARWEGLTGADRLRFAGALMEFVDGWRPKQQRTG
ncbi:MAG TPA: helix-turn-helix transcriptional regulator [Nocardioides sp.]|nr:helix-turn-helix transcriptional regulator [Nocardioides sp.]